MRTFCSLGILALAFVLALPAGVSAAAATYVNRVFDTSKLHHIVVTIPNASLRTFKSRTAGRVRCTVVFDGEIVRDAGVRQSGTFEPYVDVGHKPSLSIKFNEFVKGQELFGLKKLIVKNMAQDRSLVNEHLTYEVYRRAGLVAPLTAYAQITINGADQGIYLLREPVNQQFLARNFGKEFDAGNLYEITYRQDPVTRTEKVNLKDEVEEKRSRTDLRALAAAVKAATPATFVRTVGPLLDIDQFITVYAVEAATSHWDGYAFNVNNNYLYHNPRDGRFVFIPYGADQSFWSTPGKRIKNALNAPVGRIAVGIRLVPELSQKFIAEVERVGQAPIWDRPALLARVAEVARVLETADKHDRTTRDIARFKSGRDLVETFIEGGGTTRGTAYLPER